MSSSSAMAVPGGGCNLTTTSSIVDITTLGQPVELGQISKELTKLWENMAGSSSRASLVNFAVYCQGVDALESNTQLISEFTRNHACRAVLLADVPETSGQRVQAWINAHCHLSRAGAKQVCCEQITFLLEGASRKLLANILFANLDSDLPLHLWWQSEIPENPNEQLWTWIDRLIFDSRTWSDSRQQLERVQQVLKSSGSRLVPCDLNWTRTLHLRQAAAQMFDNPENLAHITKIDQITLVHAPGSRSTAVLFGAWIAAQLGWTLERREAGDSTFQTPTGQTVLCAFQEKEGADISRCCFGAGEVSIDLTREDKSPYYRAEVQRGGHTTWHHLLPAGSEGTVDLLDEELTSGGRHKVYIKTLPLALAML
jgi:glucose-6-phosphate dehydrogenase assembly protein OpcA